jgi:two-component system phosphate regulon sensor histidine kinase PhoR
MIAAALGLAYLGYESIQNLLLVHQRDFKKAADAQAKDVTDWLTVLMDGEVNRLFVSLGYALDDPSRPQEGKCFSESPQLVTGFAIYHDRPTPTVVCTAPDNLRRGLRNQIEDLDSAKYFKWGTVPVGLLQYVHIDKQSLFVVTKYRAFDMESYLLVAKLDLQYIMNTWLVQELRKLGELYRVALVDERGKALPEAVFGGSEPLTSERFLYDEPLGKQLYAFNLRLAPKEETKQEIEADLARQRVVRPTLVVLATIIIAFGMGIVLTSVITERRASQLKSDFIANVSHELKTPLSLIRMFGEMVATGRHKGEETAREYGSIITRESERLSHLIDNVLDFARLERGKASYDFIEGDLGPMLERALDVCRYRLEKERLKLRTRVERQLPLVRMDENAITLVILNLVDNALKYAVEGGVVEVALERSPGGVSLSVRDFGPGIPLEEQARIFERFYRAQSARDRNVRGSGIGLALVKHIAEAHGGHVSVESPVQSVHGGSAGSLFRVYLPSAGGATAEPVISPIEATTKS